jgi:hypothetical protein
MIQVVVPSFHVMSHPLAIRMDVRSVRMPGLIAEITPRRIRVWFRLPGRRKSTIRSMLRNVASTNPAMRPASTLRSAMLRTTLPCIAMVVAILGQCRNASRHQESCQQYAKLFHLFCLPGNRTNCPSMKHGALTASVVSENQRFVLSVNEH